MTYNLNELNIKDEIIIDEIVCKDELLDSRIYDLKDSYVNGKIFLNSRNEIIINCIFKGTMFISDSISLEIIPYNFEINIDENINSIEENYPESYKNKQNVLDLKGILWQNIVLEVPISYSKVNDAHLLGDGWELLKEEKKKELDPRLKKLEDLLKGDD